MQALLCVSKSMVLPLLGPSWNACPYTVREAIGVEVAGIVSEWPIEAAPISATPISQGHTARNDQAKYPGRAIPESNALRRHNNTDTQTALNPRLISRIHCLIMKSHPLFVSRGSVDARPSPVNVDQMAVSDLQLQIFTRVSKKIGIPASRLFTATDSSQLLSRSIC